MTDKNPLPSVASQKIQKFSEMERKVFRSWRGPVYTWQKYFGCLTLRVFISNFILAVFFSFLKKTLKKD